MSMLLCEEQVLLQMQFAEKPIVKMCGPSGKFIILQPDDMALFILESGIALWAAVCVCVCVSKRLQIDIPFPLEFTQLP